MFNASKEIKKQDKYVICLNGLLLCEWQAGFEGLKKIVLSKDKEDALTFESLFIAKNIANDLNAKVLKVEETQTLNLKFKEEVDF